MEATKHIIILLLVLKHNTPQNVNDNGGKKPLLLHKRKAVIATVEIYEWICNEAYHAEDVFLVVFLNYEIV